MPSTLDKTRKHIAKKRNGDVSALHVKSRNSMRLNKACKRDERLEKLASSRSKREQPIGESYHTRVFTCFTQTNVCSVDRVAYFREGLSEKGGTALELDVVQQLIKT